ncbi:MAG: hypothetical protein ACR2PD_03430 [Luminiphilus sp.]
MPLNTVNAVLSIRLIVLKLFHRIAVIFEDSLSSAVSPGAFETAPEWPMVLAMISGVDGQRLNTVQRDDGLSCTVGILISRIVGHWTKTC